jgi:hypothetical protein
MSVCARFCCECYTACRRSEALYTAATLHCKLAVLHTKQRADTKLSTAVTAAITQHRVQTNRCSSSTARNSGRRMRLSIHAEVLKSHEAIV